MDDWSLEGESLVDGHHLDSMITTSPESVVIGGDWGKKQKHRVFPRWMADRQHDE